MDFNCSYNVFVENYNIDDLQPATVLTADNGLPTTHDDVAAENRVPQSDADWQEHSLVTLGTENIWQDHQLLQFKQQVNIWNMMSYRMWETKQQQQHPIPVYWNAWTVANHTSISCAALADNVFICPYPQVHCLEHKSFSVPSHTPFPIHTPNTTPKSTSKSSNNGKQQKRTRINYTNEQFLILESIFQNNRYLNRMMRECLANELGITEKQVKIWFQNRRSKKTKV